MAQRTLVLVALACLACLAAVIQASPVGGEGEVHYAKDALVSFLAKLYISSVSSSSSSRPAEASKRDRLESLVRRLRPKLVRMAALATVRREKDQHGDGEEISFSTCFSP